MPSTPSTPGQNPPDQSGVTPRRHEHPAAPPPELGTREVRQITTAVAAGAAAVAERSAMGLKGLWGQVASMSAVGLICLMFYLQFGEMMRAAREDRLLLREAMALVRQEGERFRDQTRQETEASRDATRRLTAAVEKLIEKLGASRP
jgi:hypothetical protein